LKETKINNVYDVHIRRGNKVIAHTSCIYANDVVQIQSLYVLKKYRGKGFGEVLLARVFDYAEERKARQIISFCGAEPFCKDGQIPLDQEVSWYEDHGFVHDHDVLGVTPCMVKSLQSEVFT